MHEYPRMMYKDGGDDVIHGRPLLTFIVDSIEEQRVAESEGWRTTTAPADVVASPRRGRPPKQREETLAPTAETI